jgi:alanine racemase
MLGQTTWIEIDADALEHNLQTFRTIVGRGRLLAAVVKANAYGHGLLEVAAVCREAGVDWLAVHSLDEGLALRHAGHKCPILCMGYVPNAALPDLVEADLRLVVYNAETLRALSKAAAQKDRIARIHFKLETGTHRQGADETQLEELLRLVNELPGLELEGASTHFANIEDTTDHRYARTQLERFRMLVEQIERQAGPLRVRHCASSAAAILFPDTHFDLIRLGIGMYGLWPSRETRVSASQMALAPPELRPVLTWKTLISQVKEVPAGRFIGYGCTYKTTRATRVGVLPVGYSDGYARELSNRGHVLVRGQRARVLGRICMNLFMVDLTDVGAVQAEEEVVLLGSQGDDRISAESLAEGMGTIHYEVLARLSRAIPRVVVRGNQTPE